MNEIIEEAKRFASRASDELVMYGSDICEHLSNYNSCANCPVSKYCESLNAAIIALNNFTILCDIT